MMRNGTWLLVGIVLGAVALGVARFLFIEPEEAVHYHANWVVMVNGQELDLSDDAYMADVVRCTTGTDVSPIDRIHMHNNEDDVVHVHHAGATWGHLMQNLGFGLGDDYLITPWGDRYFAEEGRELRFILNGQVFPSIRNEVVRSQDRLLISYGDEPLRVVQGEQFPLVEDTALNYNQAMDPGSCGHGGEPSVWDRLRAAFWG